LGELKKEKRIMHKTILGLVAATILATTAPSLHAQEPSEKDVRYSKEFERSVMDIWTVKSDKPTPLVVYFHGGGFKAGDKNHFNRSLFLKNYHAKGVAFASINYPFLNHTNNNYFAILNHTTQAIRFLGANAKKYNIDTSRISVMGSSAGALISCHLGHGANLPICSVYGHMQPMGTTALVVPQLRRGGPPIVMYNKDPNDKIHHPDNAVAVMKRCSQLGVYCQGYGEKASGLTELPADKDITDMVMQVFFKSWRLPFPDAD